MAVTVLLLLSVTLAVGEVLGAAPSQLLKLYPVVTVALTCGPVPQSNRPPPLAVPPDPEFTVSLHSNTAWTDMSSLRVTVLDFDVLELDIVRRVELQCQGGA